MPRQKKNFIPAFRFHWLTPLFDPIMRATVHDVTLKQHLVKEAPIQKKSRVLDLGCGTGTLAILVKKAHPEAEVTGLDADERILDIARSKIAESGLIIKLDKGLASDLPYADESVDIVLSSLVFHHLNSENKILALKEAYRILRPNGQLLILDFGKPNNFLMRLITLIMRNLEETADNYKGLLPKMIRDAGFVQVEIAAQYSTVFGTICIYKGMKPA